MHLQRFLRAEISELALLSILRLIFGDCPEILRKFDEITQLNVFVSNEENFAQPISSIPIMPTAEITQNRFDDISPPVARISAVANTHKNENRLSRDDSGSAAMDIQISVDRMPAIVSSLLVMML